MSTPVNYIMPKVKSVSKMSDELLDVKPWCVYSDKIYNISNRYPKGKPFAKLDYFSSFYVLKEQDGYLLIVKDLQLKEGMFLSDKAIFYGWVESENMLLWSHCLLTDKYENYKKVVLINNTHKSNSLFSQKPPVSNRIDCYYVYKEEKDKILLGKQPVFITTDIDVSDYFMGWYPIELLVHWDNNLALRLNTDKIAIKERKNKNIAAKVFKYGSSAKRYSKKLENDYFDVIWGENLKDTSVKLEVFPVIEIGNNGVVKVITDINPHCVDKFASNWY